MRYLPVVLLALAACSQKGSKSVSQSQTDSIVNALQKKFADTTFGRGASGGHTYGPPTGKIRVANMVVLNGKPGGPVDLYDVSRPDSAAMPLIKDLAYGQVSDYVSPRAGGPGNLESNLWFFPAGTKTASFPYGTNIDHAFYEPGDQITVALGPSTMQIGFPALDEAGKRVNSYRDSLRIIPAGMALLVLLQANVSADSIPLLYLMIDGTCPLTSVFPKNKIPTSIGTDINFGVTPGTHTLGIVTSPRGHGLLNCNGKTPGSTTPITVTAGERYVVFVYGVPSTGFKILTAPMATP